MPPLATAAAIAALLFGSWQWRARSGENFARQVATESSGMKKVELPDGSAVYLNADSRIDVHFSTHERRVQLQRGEAHFAVAKNSLRPFVVLAGEVAVRAVGTAFDVRLGTHAVEVLVTEGKVRIADAHKGASLLAAGPASMMQASPQQDPELLVAGQRITVKVAAETPQPARAEPIAATQIEEALAWRSRQLEFDMTPLADVVAEFNHYNTHQLIIADADLARENFGGSFRADNYRVFVGLLEQRFGVIAEREENRTVLRRAK
jgi:transmembrane sensor